MQQRMAESSPPEPTHNPEDGEHVLPFGKWRGTSIQNVPKEYLNYLCLWDNYKTSQKTRRYRNVEQWLLKKHPRTVNAARTYVKNRNMCRVCFRPLAAIGNARANGAPHADWAGRYYHKRCWRDLETDTESEEESDEE